MSAKTEATIDDLYRKKGKAELVHGEIQLMSPTGGLPGYAATRISASLDAHARSVGRGYAIGDNVGFIVDLPHRKSFSPDAALYLGKLRMRFLEGADLLNEDTVRVYRAGAPSQPAIYRRGDLAEAEPAVPGWTMSVDEFFPQED